MAIPLGVVLFQLFKSKLRIGFATLPKLEGGVKSINLLACDVSSFVLGSSSLLAFLLCLVFRALAFILRISSPFGIGKTAKKTSFHRGGGTKRLERTIDLKRNVAPSSLGVIEQIEHDPNRSSSIALIRCINGIRCHAMLEKLHCSTLVQYREKPVLHLHMIQRLDPNFFPLDCSGSSRASFFAPRARGEDVAGLDMGWLVNVGISLFKPLHHEQNQDWLNMEGGLLSP
ncbi:hypothetical protein PIB30_013304 [Stylosanthes scabra]|uniref:Large ribosomal subunit protein uL2 RNA-binding domain-containing protein n=1 Tax=Stylosanthes scabra TaxID=79078 RepID=A0ABU6T6N0_9FABA|nr:hypothetical protein [Stylosanthes scabra]